MMVVLKVAPIFLLVLVAGADKKIELQDIENDNLKSEKETEYDKTEQRSQISGPESGPGLPSLDFLKNGFLRYFEGPSHPPQQTRYVQQYAVTEQPERSPVAVTPKAQYTHQQYFQQPQQLQHPQQAMVGYLSNVPMQIYLVPQYYNEASEQGQQSVPQFTTAPAAGRVPGYPTAPEAVQPQTNYIEVPTYVAPTQKTYIPQYSSQPVAYVSFAAPTATPTPTIAPVVAYQLPVVQYQAAQTSPKEYYPHYTDSNNVEEGQESVDESPKQYTHTDVSYTKSPASDFRYYTARPQPPPREDYRHHHNYISELPHPNPLLLKASPPHLANIPKALPVYRPLNKPVYGSSPIHASVPFPRPSEPYGPPPYKRRPTSLLDSYVPSSLQIEYMKRGLTNDPIAAYEALSSGRHFSHGPAPRHFERGFLPNQMYHTAGGGTTYGHYKRTPKIDKVSQK